VGVDRFGGVTKLRKPEIPWFQDRVPVGFREAGFRSLDETIRLELITEILEQEKGWRMGVFTGVFAKMTLHGVVLLW
jgi:hypothetical protein